MTKSELESSPSTQRGRKKAFDFPARTPFEGAGGEIVGLFAENMENEVDKYEIFVKLNKVQKAYAFFMVCKQTMRQGLYAGITKKFGGL
ncbi:hypothetical protein AALA80_15340 [Oscillospiraceae bacterium 50-60]